MFGADRGGDRVEMPHALDEPGQFVGGDFIGVGIAGLDIGALQLCEMAAGRPRIPRPCLDQPGGSGRDTLWTPITNSHLLFPLLLSKKHTTQLYSSNSTNSRTLY